MGKHRKEGTDEQGDSRSEMCILVGNVFDNAYILNDLNMKDDLFVFVLDSGNIVSTLNAKYSKCN